MSDLALFGGAPAVSSDHKDMFAVLLAERADGRWHIATASRPHRNRDAHVRREGTLTHE